jgi:hypothetical protein
MWHIATRLQQRVAQVNDRSRFVTVYSSRSAALINPGRERVAAIPP